jgi:zinc transport system ATP-binding protein
MPAVNKNILEVKNLTVNFDSEKVIENLSFAIKANEFLTIIGPNGSGKSVLLKALLGLLPYSGEINWQAENRIGYLPQGLTQMVIAKNFPLTIYDFFALKKPTPSKSVIIKYASLVGLDESELEKTVGDLSGGQFQRMLFAWVLISKPRTIVLDEPTTGIDIGGGETIYTLLREIWEKEKLTILMVSHDLNIVFAHSTNVLCLNRKKHFCYGAPTEILTPKMLEEAFGMEIKFYEHK